MSNELVVKSGREFDSGEIQLIKDTVCKGTTDGEFKLFIYQCKRTGLDPFSRQIHAVKRWDAKMGREVMSIQTGIDGYRLIADRTGLYAGSDDAVFDTETASHPGKATVTVWKIVNGQRVPFSASARWDEYCQTKKGGELNIFWANKPYLMLAKCAESLALRKAFPQELSGIYTHEEMGNEIMEAEVSAPATQPQVAQPAKQLPPAEPKPVNGNGNKAKLPPPATGQEFLRRMTDKETELVRTGQCKPGDMLRYIQDGAKIDGIQQDFSKWGASEIKWGLKAGDLFINNLKQPEKVGA